MLYYFWVIFLKNNEFITNFFKNNSVYEVGFAKVDNELPYAISVVIPLSQFVIEKIDSQPTYEYFHHYRSINAFIDNVLLKAGLEIGNLGYKYLCVGASHSTGEYKGYFPHKTAANLAGLGFIGKNAMFISAKYGSAVRLGTILTDMPFDTGTPLNIDCGDCNICQNVCPAMAIHGVNYYDGIAREEMFDASACSTHMKKAYQHIGRGVVCGLCMRNCKYFKRGL